MSLHRGGGWGGGNITADTPSGFFWHSAGFNRGGGEGGGIMKPLAAVATSFFTMKLLFSSRRKSKSNHSQVEVRDVL